MTITEKINGIIDRRIGRNGFEGKGHLEVIRKKKEFYVQLLSKLEEFQMLRNNVLGQIEAQRGEYYQMAMEDPTFQQRMEGADPGSVIDWVSKCQKECERLEKRFNRETINISVVGRARQGKSRLLQSISGLPNEIIPADDGGDCTGAKSVISNSQGPTHAVVSFYSEMEILTAVNDYLTALDSGFVIGNVAQIPVINLQQIEDGIKTGTDKTSLLGHLSKYVNNYSSYAHLLGTSLPVNDPAEIRRYTSQYLTNGQPTFEYLGVKEVKIFTEFNYADAGKIQLVDTIGLFDTALGLEKKMMNTLADESDAAILLRMPNYKGDHVDEHDNKLYNDIERSLGQETLSKWLFYVLNVWSENSKSGAFMHEQLKAQFGKTLRAAFVKEVDCASQEAVEREIVIPILETLSTNLGDVDNNLMSKANALFDQCYGAYIDLLGRVNAVLSSNFKQAIKSGGLFDKLFVLLQLPRRLEELTDEYKDHERECTVIKEEVVKVLHTLYEKCPGEEEILDRLSSGTRDARPEIVYSHYADFTRAAISDQFEEINRSTIFTLQEALKERIIDILRADDGGMLNHIPVDEEDTDDNKIWLAAFIEQKLGDFPIVQMAFEDVLNYRLNIEGLLEYKVNMSLENLDPESAHFMHLDLMGTTTKQEQAERIRTSILNTLPNIARQLVDSMGDILRIPYNSYYAHARKLRERIIYSEEGNEQLKEFYRDNATYVWHDDFASIAGKQTALESLRNISENLAQLRSKNLFLIKL